MCAQILPAMPNGPEPTRNKGLKSTCRTGKTPPQASNHYNWPISQRSPQGEGRESDSLAVAEEALGLQERHVDEIGRSTVWSACAWERRRSRSAANVRRSAWALRWRRSHSRATASASVAPSHKGARACARQQSSPREKPPRKSQQASTRRGRSGTRRDVLRVLGVGDRIVPRLLREPRLAQFLRELPVHGAVSGFLHSRQIGIFDSIALLIDLFD